VQVIRVYKNAEEAEVQFTVSSWSLKYSSIFRLTVLQKWSICGFCSRMIRYWVT
jgi:hypothetical protein